MAKTKEVTKGDVHMTSWLQAEEVPRAGLPDARKLNKRRRNFRIAVWTILILTPVTGFLTVAALSTAANAPKPIVPDAVLSSPGRAAASVALDNWLNSKPSPIPGGRALLWSGVISLPNAPTTTTAAANANANGVAPSPVQIGTEIDKFVVVGADGATYEASLQVALNNVGAASVIAGPSLTPIPTMSQGDLSTIDSPWPDLTVGSAADPVNTAVQGWATAFTGGNAAALRQVVGDPDNGHSYLPLSGVGAVTVAIGNAAIPVGGAAADHLLVRVTVTPVPIASTNGEASVTPVGFTYDLLVEHASTAAPVVIAWGSPGSGPTLTPYQNALSAASEQTSIGMLHPTGLLTTSSGAAPSTAPSTSQVTSTVTTTVSPAPVPTTGKASAPKSAKSPAPTTATRP